MGALKGGSWEGGERDTLSKGMTPSGVRATIWATTPPLDSSRTLSKPWDRQLGLMWEKTQGKRTQTIEGMYRLTGLRSSGGGLASGPAGAECSNAALRKLQLPSFHLSLGSLLCQAGLSQHCCKGGPLGNSLGTTLGLFPSSSHRNPRADSHWAMSVYVAIPEPTVARGRDRGDGTSLHRLAAPGTEWAGVTPTGRRGERNPQRARCLLGASGRK